MFILCFISNFGSCNDPRKAEILACVSLFARYIRSREFSAFTSRPIVRDDRVSCISTRLQYDKGGMPQSFNIFVGIYWHTPGRARIYETYFSWPILILTLRGFLVPRDSHAHICSILPNHFSMLKAMFWGTLLVATSLLHT